MTKQMLGPDVRLLETEKLVDIAFPGGRQQAFRIFIDPQVHDGIWKHAQEDMSVEICGVLVGQWGRDPDGPFASISAFIRGHAAANKLAEVTFTHETWSKINAEMDGKYADRAIVGWYHTHPDFGIFLSDRDRFIHEHFFSSPGQVAMVVDPVREIEGIFVWREGKTVLLDHYWIGDRIQAGVPEKAESKATAAAPPPSDAAFNLGRGWVTPAQYVLVFLIGFLLAARLNDSFSRRAESNAETIAYFQYGMRPDLDKRLDAIRKNLAAVEEAAPALEKDHLEWLAKSNPDDKAELAAKRRESWEQLQAAVLDSKRRVDLVEQEYCLAPEQRVLLDELRARKERENEERQAKEQAEAKAKQQEEAKPKPAASKPAEPAQPAAGAPAKKDVPPEGPKSTQPEHQ